MNELPSLAALLPRLRPREREFVAVVLSGESSVDWARRVYISPKTAEAHTANLRRAAGLSRSTHVREAVLRMRIADLEAELGGRRG
jgi:DNA-binding CsgD family transcriptional regulator